MILRLLSSVPLALALCSCGTMDTLKEGTTASVEKVGDSLGKVGDGFGKVGDGFGHGFQRVAGLASSPFKPRVPVVEARPDAWQKLPSGHERALAYQEKQRQRRFWLFAPPVDFQEPELPELSTEPTTAGLLPPKD